VLVVAGFFVCVLCSFLLRKVLMIVNVDYCMDLKTALENIKVMNRGRFPFEEISLIRQNWGEAQPALLEYVKDQLRVDWSKIGDDDFSADTRDFFASHLLAEHNCVESFQYLIQYLEYADEAVLDFLLSDSLTEGFPGVLATVATRNDVNRVKQVIENTHLDEFARLCAVTTLGLMYMRDFLSYEELDRYLCGQLEINKDNYDFLTPLLNECMDFYLQSCFDKVDLYFKENRVNERYAGLAWYRNKIATSSIENALEELRNNPHHKLVTLTVTDELANLPWFEKPDWREELGVKIGRNEPCPCGSGKKFKKCCGP
jgi:hypothetical protein